ncbi:MAG: hypothetical protein JKY98_03905 [Gammaproteobacteria bacterium]|nr:hypothetical protein [Gammaproteobacteria bacterium]
MPTNCEEKLTADILKDCDNKPVGGIEVNVVIINFEDVDKGSSTIDGANDLIITNLATNSGTQGHFLEGIKQVNGVSSELVKKEESYDMHKHVFAGVILTPSAANKKHAAELSSGNRYVVVVEKKFKGASQADAFEVLGWDSGLVISTMVYNSKESDGVIKFELASEDGFEEPELPRNLLETNYATTLVAFNAKFVTP